MNITEHFKFSEFACKDGTQVPIQFFDNVKALCMNLEVIRSHINRSIIITSGYRTESHNKKVGGAKYSMHLCGKAADMKVKGMTSKEIYEVIEELIGKGEIQQGGLSKIDLKRVHYDIRGYKKRW